eukprot:TRINITY_DN8976_c0_g1_i2.p1 TRINITY_DN8976_c0_g1~~TRINITY_DN8976_c0_g1_i2.p1  ORF type:complete len:421 (+),score=60.38 TRINITY_DN8976_c0_g1_i2:1431-2693(+)
MAQTRFCVLLCTVFVVGYFYATCGFKIDIPILWDTTLNLTSHPCTPKISPNVPKLVHSHYEIHWPDNNPSLIIYPLYKGELLWDKCLVIDVQSWHESGQFNESCRIYKSFYGPYTMSCADEITPFSSLKELEWDFTKNDTTINWTAEIAEGSRLEIFFELIQVDTNRTFYNSDNTGSRTLQLLKDSFEFSFSVTNYSLKYEYPEKLGGDYYEFQIGLAFLMTGAVKVFTIPIMGESPAMIPERVLDFLNGKPFVPYPLDEPSMNVIMQKADNTFNVTMGLATFLQSDPPTISTVMSKYENRSDLIGFDSPLGKTGKNITYKGEVIGQTFKLGLAMSIKDPQSIFFDPNIALLFDTGSTNGEGEASESSGANEDLIIGLVVGLTGFALLLVVVAVVVSLVVLKRKRAQQKAIISGVAELLM